MSVFNTLHIGRTGLKVAAYGVQVAGQNVTNASTEGYVARRLAAETRGPHRTGNGVFQGQGVQVGAVKRQIDRFVTERAFEALGDHSQASTAHASLQVVEANFREGDSAGISERLDGFFDAITEMTSEPGDHGLRLAVKDAGQDLVDATARAGRALQESIRRTEDRIRDEVTGINQLLSDIEALNRRISDSDAVNGPADLMDARDGLVEKLAEKTGVGVDYKANGQISLYIGGFGLVQEVHAQELKVEGAVGELSIKMILEGGQVTLDKLVKGELGGLLQARDQSGATLSALDEFALDFVDEINLQHSGGFDRLGVPGLDFFVIDPAATSASVGMRLDSSLAAEPDLIAAAGSASAEVGDGANLDAILTVEDTKLFDSGTLNSREFVASIYSDLGSAVAGFEMDAVAHAAIVSDLTSLKDAASGVDLDEEAVSLMQWQASYEAAARVITAANDMLEILMRTVGR